MSGDAEDHRQEGQKPTLQQRGWVPAADTPGTCSLVLVALGCLASLHLCSLPYNWFSSCRTVVRALGDAVYEVVGVE